MKRFKMTQEEYEKVKSTLKTNTDRNAERRLKVLMLRHEGHKLAEISEMTGMQINSISQMCRRYREQGLGEFVRNKYTSHRHALTVEQENAILNGFEKRIKAGESISASEIKKAFDEVRQKDTGRGYIYMVLKRHGWQAMRKSPAPNSGSTAPKGPHQVCWVPGKKARERD